VKTGRKPPSEADVPGLFPWTGMRWGTPGPEEGFVVVEEPLEIRVDEHLVAVLMRTPGFERELAVGYCLGEGILSDAGAIESVELQGEGGTTCCAAIALHPSAAVDPQSLGQPRFVRSGCAANMPGSWGCDLPPVGDGTRVSDKVLRESVKSLAGAQGVYKVAGGIHAAGAFSADGTPVVVCEDIGRHNAVDKVLGYCILRGISLEDKFILGTGRASYEFVTKSARLGVRICASLSSPTSLSVQLADVLNQTLVGYLRPNRFVVYTHPWRLYQAAG